MDSVVSFRHSDGRYEINRVLTASERRSIKGRSDLITNQMRPARVAYLEDCVMQMMIGFGGARPSADEAAAIAAQYASVLFGLPGWAVKRSCNLWAAGHVTPAEIGQKTINRDYPPSAAQVRLVSENVLRPFMQEYARLQRTLAASVVPPELSKEERERIAARFDQINAECLSNEADRDLEAKALTVAAEEDKRAARARNERHILEEYRMKGLTPPPGGVVSLSTLLTMGWRIDSGRLIQPPERVRSDA